jgi:hypothetical protein
MSAIDATSPTAAKGGVRASSGGADRSHAAVRGAGGGETTRPDESMPAHAPELATRTMGVRFSMHRKRESCRCCMRPPSNHPNHPSLLMQTIRSARLRRPAGPASKQSMRQTHVMASSKQMGTATRAVPPDHGTSNRTGAAPASRSKVMPCAPSASSERSSHSQFEM